MIGAAAFLPSFFLCVRVRETEVGDGRKEGKKGRWEKKRNPVLQNKGHKQRERN